MLFQTGFRDLPDAHLDHLPCFTWRDQLDRQVIRRDCPASSIVTALKLLPMNRPRNSGSFLVQVASGAVLVTFACFPELDRSLSGGGARSLRSKEYVQVSEW